MGFCDEVLFFFGSNYRYLQEIGYTDTIIDVRSARVRTLLGLAPSNSENEDKQNISSILNGEQVKRASDTQLRRY